MKKQKLVAFAGIAAACALLAILIGCGGSNGSGTGTLRVAMVDAPDPTVTAVNVTIDRVEAHVNNEWTTISSGAQAFNLLDLVQDDVVLASAELPTGHYTQVRIFVSNATVTDAAGTHPVTIPSGVQTGIKININHDINEGEVTAILLDFNVEKSINKLGNGQYHMQPVIPAVVQVLSGTVTGTVTRGGSPQQGATVKAIYTAGPNYALGTEVNTNMTLADGTFKIWALLPGTYTITASYTDPGTLVTTNAQVTGVNVTASGNAAVGTMPLL